MSQHELYYDSNVHSKGARLNDGTHFVIIGPNEARDNLMTKDKDCNLNYVRKMNIITIITHCCKFNPNLMRCIKL